MFWKIEFNGDSVFECALVVDVLQPFSKTLKRLGQIPTLKQVTQPLTSGFQVGGELPVTFNLDLRKLS